jgi:hypothetical protein
MTREDIIGLIAEASAHDPGFSVWVLSTPHIERIVNRAVEAEREACAQVAEAWDADHPKTNYGLCIGNAIRARGSDGKAA